MRLKNQPYFCCIAAVLALSLTACTTPGDPYNQYKVVQERETPVALDDRQAISNAVTLKLPPGQRVKAEITPDDPKIQHKSTQSNYKVFALQGKKGSRYTVELRSLCNCWGLDKFILYPVARILDEAGNIINNNPVNISLREPDWNYPVNIHMLWEGMFDEDGLYYFLVSSYNDNIGNAYLTFTEFDYLASQIQKVSVISSYLDLLARAGNSSGEVSDPSAHHLWSYPTGKIIATFTMVPE